MKVDGPNRTQKAGQTQKKGKVSGDGSFSSMIDGGAKDVAGTKTTQSIAQVDALLAVQGAEDPTEKSKRQRMRHRADTILNELEKVRMAMLTGDLTVGHVIDIAGVVASHREKIVDPQLTAILDEIDLRAQVEIAKMRVSANKL